MTTPPNPYDFPIVLSASGLQPQSPTEILQQLLAQVTTMAPGYTANLPGSLVEDVSSTDVAAIALCNQAQVELVNSLTPFAANIFILTQLGQIYGVTLGQPTNTSVQVVFSGTVGYVIANGFLVSDGTNAYQVQVGGVIGGGGSSASLTAVAISTASFSVPANTVTQLLTSVPSSVTLTVNNPSAGTPAGAPETYYAFRARVLTAGLAACVSSARFIKTIVGQVLGAQGNLISVQQASGGLRVVVGGSADQYEIANAIFMSVAAPALLQESAVNTGRDVTVSLVDYPDTYQILYVASPLQTVTMSIVWNTTLSSFTGGAAFSALVQPPLVAYINGLGIGQVINVLEMNELFQNAVEDLLDASLLTRLVFTVSINSTVTPPASGTYAVSGDPESYFFTALNGSGISVTQG
jgi:hypothetical protein